MLALLFNLICTYQAIKQVRYFTTKSQNLLSNAIELKYNWLRIILKITFTLLFLWAIAFVFEIIFSINTTLYYIYNCIYIFVAIVLLVFGYVTVLKPYLPNEYLQANEKISDTYTPQEVTNDNNGEKIESNSCIEINATLNEEFVQSEEENNSELSNKEANTHLKLKEIWLKLEEYMEAHKPYIKKDITLAEIAEYLGATTFNLSKTIKHYAKQDSFYDYINYYRMQYFLQLLQNNEYDYYTLQALGAKAGFASTTTLVKYCKKYAKSTPNELRKARKML
ncbi:MAG: helix-turn-helix domain-containing protein [Ferruginibacter sp.]|nr:helix-turn-helix domain-containing protein [Ferruginibacter sp.]